MPEGVLYPLGESWCAVGLADTPHLKFRKLPFRKQKERLFSRPLYPLGESNPHLKFRKLPFYPLN